MEDLTLADGALCEEHDVLDDDAHRYYEHEHRGRLTASSDVEEA